MKVAMIQSTEIPPVEGIGNHTYNLASELHNRGHEVEFFTRGGFKGSVDTVDNFRVYRPACPPVYPLHTHLHRFPLQRAISKHGPYDIVHLHSPLVPMPSIDTPTIATVHTPIGPDVESVTEDTPGHSLFRLQKPFSESVETSVVENADAVTTVSGSIAELTEEEYDRNAEVVNNGVNIDEFDPLYDRGNDPTLLYVGRLGPRKGVRRLLDVAERLADREVEFNLQLAGRGPLESDLRDRIHANGLKDSVELLGFVERDRLLELLRTCTVFVHVPDFEGLPTTVVEAMASGAPVVTTDVPGCRDAVVDGETGAVVDPENIDGIVTAVERLLNSQRLRVEFGRAARSRVEQRFSFVQIAKDYESLYQEVA